MPKIRNKNSGNINKSGALTQTYKSYFKEDREKYSFFKKEVNHRSLGSNNENIFFDDSKSIMFVEKDLNPTLSIDPNHETKLLSTPNTFPDESTVQTSVLRDKEYYNFSIEENYTENDYNIYNEGFYDSTVVDKKENIVINFERNQYSPIHLSAGWSGILGSNVTDASTSIVYTDVVTFQKPTNSHTIYLSQDSTYDDYLNDVTYNMYEDFNKFCLSEDFTIPYSSLTYSTSSQDTTKVLTNHNMPIQDFGFPYSGKFRPKDRHVINASKYINRPFVIEKVVLKTNISNWSVSDVDQNALCLNFINFFILNQRGKLNSLSLEQQRQVKRYDSDSNDFELHNVDNLYDDETYTQQWTNFISTEFSPNFWQKLNFNVETLSFTEPVKASQRELITSVKITNYAKNESFPYIENESYLSHDTDLLIDKSGASQQVSGSYAECIYENLPINITSDVKITKKNDLLPRFSKFELYPKKLNSTRTNTSKRSERSLKSELNSFNNTFTRSDSRSAQIRDYGLSDGNSVINNEYVIYPEDELIFGINLAPSYLPAGSSGDEYNYDKLYGRDVVHINGDIDFVLVGYYLQNEEEKTISHKNHYENANMKRIGYSFSEVVDDFGQPEIYLSKGSYYDLIPAVATAGYSFGILQSNYYSRRVGRGFGNFLTLPNTSFLNINRTSPLENYEIVGLRYKENETSDYKLIKQYFNLNKFGQPAFKINFNRYIQHEDMDLNNIINYFINKKYKRGLFTEKSLSDGDTFNSYNTTQRASLTDVQIAFKEGEGI